MSRRAASAVIGSSGESWVKAVFGEMGWLVSVPESGDDLGTDMLLQPTTRDHELLPFVLGVQVKSAATCQGGYFRDMRRGRRELFPRAWRVPVKSERATDWLRSTSPYLLVLWCAEHKRGYWSLVTDDTVHFTKSRATVEVPSAQTLAAKSASEILACAARAGARMSWEGSLGVWPGALPPSDVLRAALLTPRLVAPRPGQPLGQLTPQEALAVLMQMREDDLDGGPERHYASALGQEPPPLPVPGDPGASKEWKWRFYGAAREFISRGLLDELRSAVKDAPRSHEVAAATALLCAGLHEQRRAHEAFDVTAEALDRELGPLDKAWVEVHRAWALVEMGRFKEARSLAASARLAADLHPQDPTAGAIRSAAADLMAVGFLFLNDGVDDLVRAGDAAANWWRTQTLSWGLGARSEMQYQAALEFQAPDSWNDAWRDLRSVMLMAGLASHRTDWRRATRLVAREQVLLALPVGHEVMLEDALEMFLAAGADDDVKTLATRLRNYGPIQPVADAAATCSLATATQTSLRAELELMEQAADVLPADVAARYLDATLSALQHPEVITDRLHLLFHLPYQLLAVATALAYPVGANGLERAAQYLAALESQPDQGLATRLAKVLQSVPASWWPAWLWAPLSERKGDHQAFTQAIESCRAELDPDFRSGLVPRVQEGDLYAVVAHGGAADLPPEAVLPLAEDVVYKVRRSIERAGHGWEHPAIDPLAVLIHLSVEDPDHERWDAICDAVAHGAGSPPHLITSLELLAGLAHRLTPEQRSDLSRALARLDSLPERWFGTAVARSELSAAIVQAQAAMDPSTLTTLKVSSLARGAHCEQRAAVLAIARTRDSGRLPALAAFLASPDPRIRGLVAHCLTGWVRDQVAPQESLEMVVALLQEAGAYLARSVGNILEELPSSKEANTLAAHLNEHPSAHARGSAQTYFSRRGD